ncbi:MAG: ATP-binding protein [Candidatus Thermoplasmatota archaeon]|nr:ATP-binding protein [Candidatus Thermoplasmatota archaeon]MCL5963943.1 ATP-binding protein [Candidatus Thermoplasmatota archaeon]
MKITEIGKMNKMQLHRSMFIGAPGIGKTEIVRQYAMHQSGDREFIDLKDADPNKLMKIYEQSEKYYVYLRIIAPHIFPEDISIPRGSDIILFKSPLTIDILARKDILGLLFIDELTNVQRADQRVLFYSMIYEGEIGWNVKLSTGITLICAGNPPEWSSDAGNLPAPLINKMMIVEVEPPNIDEWIEYMDSISDWNRIVATFLKAYPNEFIKKSSGESLTPFPTPRAYTELAKKLFNAPDNLIPTISEGILGPDTSAYFISFIRTKIPTIGEFLSQPDQWYKFKNEQKYLMLHTIVQNIDKTIKEHSSNLGKFLSILIKSERDMMVLLIKLIPKRNREKIIYRMPFKIFIDQLLDELAPLNGV